MANWETVTSKTITITVREPEYPAPTITSFNISPSEVNPGDSFTATVVIKNNASVSASGGTVKIKTGSTVLGSASVGTIGPNSTKQVTVNCTASLSKGTYPLTAEVSLTINGQTKTATASGPTLKVVVPAWPPEVQLTSDKTTVQVGEVISFTVEVRNPPENSEDMTNISVTLKRNGTSLDTKSLGTLSPGQSATVTFSDSPPQEGTYQYQASVSATVGGEAVGGKSNIVTVTANPQSNARPPKIQAEADRTTIQQGESVNFSVTVQNISDEGINITSGTVEMLVDGQSVQTKNIPNPPVGSGMARTLNFSYTFNSPGTHTVQFKATATFSNGDTLSNTSQPITITVQGDVTAVEPKITLDQPASAQAGETITLNVVITNQDSSHSITQANIDYTIKINLDSGETIPVSSDTINVLGVPIGPGENRTIKITVPMPSKESDGTVVVDIRVYGQFDNGYTFSKTASTSFRYYGTGGGGGGNTGGGGGEEGGIGGFLNEVINYAKEHPIIVAGAAGALLLVLFMGRSQSSAPVVAPAPMPYYPYYGR